MKTAFLSVIVFFAAFSVVAQTNTAYQVGDTGPAGGVIFYDKGNNADGWRYLEAAPAAAEDSQMRPWGTRGHDVTGTLEGIGAGKQNTQLAVDALTQLGEVTYVARICAALKFGGYNDWFLPSKDELELLYTTLKLNNLAGLGDAYYWSSTQDDTEKVWSCRFDRGAMVSLNKNTRCKFRAIRAF